MPTRRRQPPEGPHRSRPSRQRRRLCPAKGCRGSRLPAGRALPRPRRHPRRRPRLPSCCFRRQRPAGSLTEKGGDRNAASILKPHRSGEELTTESENGPPSPGSRGCTLQRQNPVSTETQHLSCPCRFAWSCRTTCGCVPVAAPDVVRRHARPGPSPGIGGGGDMHVHMCRPRSPGRATRMLDAVALHRLAGRQRRHRLSLIARMQGDEPSLTCRLAWRCRATRTTMRPSADGASCTWASAGASCASASVGAVCESVVASSASGVARASTFASFVGTPASGASRSPPSAPPCAVASDGALELGAPSLGGIPLGTPIEPPHPARPETEITTRADVQKEDARCIPRDIWQHGTSAPCSGGATPRWPGRSCCRTRSRHGRRGVARSSDPRRPGS